MQIPHGTMIALVDSRGFSLFRNIGNDAVPDVSPAAGPKLGNDPAPVAAWLNLQVADGAIDLLIVVAPEDMLEALRGYYTEATADALICEIPADVLGMEGLEALAPLIT